MSSLEPASQGSQGPGPCPQHWHGGLLLWGWITAPPLSPRPPPCCSAVAALFPQQDCATPAASPGMCPSPWCQGRPRDTCLLWLRDRDVSQQPCAPTLLGFLLSATQQGARRGLDGNQQPEAKQHHPRSTASCVPAPPARALGAQGSPPLPCPHQLDPMLRNKRSGQPQTEKSFYWYHT